MSSAVCVMVAVPTLIRFSLAPLGVIGQRVAAGVEHGVATDAGVGWKRQALALPRQLRHVYIQAAGHGV